VKRSTCLIFLPVLLIAGCNSQQSNSGNGAPTVATASLKAAAKDPGVRAFYSTEGWQAVWSKKAEKALGQALSQRAANGLDHVVFLTDAAKQSPEMREASLTKAALAYASALAKGVVDPKGLYKIYAMPRPDPDLAAGLRGALQNGKLEQWFASLAPQDTEYRSLSLVYRQMRQATSDQASAGIPADGAHIRPGQSDARIPRIAAVLHTIGYLPDAADPKSQRYTPAIAGAVRQFQKDSGDKADGTIVQDTIAELNTAPADRARAAAVALERRRWLQRTPPETRIDVNIATATLNYIRGGQSVDQRRVIVGQPGWETPQIQASFYRLVANPTWTVPKTIEAKEMSNASAAYLKKNHMIRKGGHIVQQSGPRNSLGLVKFDLDDPYAIYLHDTPAKSWFTTDTRHRSHGCVRVQDALGFAQKIAGDEQITAEWQKAEATGKESFVKLPRPIAVRLLYHPTWADSAGKVHFDQDIYGWNTPIAGPLGFGPGRARKMAPPVNDIGP
jgi:murein L,D-transpeptidase YcbB/YkuD